MTKVKRKGDREGGKDGVSVEVPCALYILVNKRLEYRNRIQRVKGGSTMLYRQGRAD